MSSDVKGLPSKKTIGDMELPHEMTGDIVFPQERTTGDTGLPCHFTSTGSKLSQEP